MFQRILSKIFGTRNDRMLASLKPTVDQVNQLEEEIKQLDDVALQAETKKLKEAIKNGQTLDDLLPRAFSVVREASRRVLGKRHYDVQIYGGIALHKGWIAEAKTGEGKTLMATLPAYLNALTGLGVHIIVPNDYLASRDSEMMGRIYTYLGLTVAYTTNEMAFEDKQNAYLSDIVYTTNYCIGFDYLRDNMRIDNEQKLIRALHFCIIDEVDSILIDEARTPLVLTGASDTSSELYNKLYAIIQTLKHTPDSDESDVDIDRKDKQVHLTDLGSDKLQAILIKNGIIPAHSNLFDIENTNVCYYANACLQARFLFQKDVEYVVDGSQVVIINESTGRKAIGKRWNNGIHQALEAKEGVEIQRETQTTASITYQNLFRLYDKLSGMTGTADTEATELKDIYDLDVLVIPPNKPCIRISLDDRVYNTREEKTEAIVADVIERHKTGQPLLIGTVSIEYSELLSERLNKANIKHAVLNAKHHEKEASIIENAGRLNAVTIATNMAGRGTDIILGGNPEKIQDWEKEHTAVLEVGGLHVLGTERHACRRIDNQLIGRSGRQGDPGSAQFYLSFDDPLMRFVPQTLKDLLIKVSNKDGPLSDPSLSRAIENAQRNVESRYYDMRKEVLKLDDVANHQRQIVYAHRNELLDTDDISEIIDSMIQYSAESVCTPFLSEDIEQWNIKGLQEELLKYYRLSINFSDIKTANEIIEHTAEMLKKLIEAKQDMIPEQQFRLIEKRCLLMVLDKAWKEHLASMDHLRQGINFRGLAQKNPTHEFKQDSFVLFEKMLRDIKINTIRYLSALSIQQEKRPTPSPQGYVINTQKKRAPRVNKYNVTMNKKTQENHETA